MQKTSIWLSSFIGQSVYFLSLPPYLPNSTKFLILIVWSLAAINFMVTYHAFKCSDLQSALWCCLDDSIFMFLITLAKGTYVYSIELIRCKHELFLKNPSHMDTHSIVVTCAWHFRANSFRKPLFYFDLFWTFSAKTNILIISIKIWN